MDNLKMIERLRNAGLSVDTGMTEQQLAEVESLFGFRFPREIREFYACGVPVGDRFFDYRDLSTINQGRLIRFWESVEDKFRLQLDQNPDTMHRIFYDISGSGAKFNNAVLEYLHASPKLLPFYGDHCFLDGMDNEAILSFRNPTDIDLRGSSFECYLESEFLAIEHELWYSLAIEIWAYLLID